MPTISGGGGGGSSNLGFFSASMTIHERERERERTDHRVSKAWRMVCNKVTVSERGKLAIYVKEVHKVLDQ